MKISSQLRNISPESYERLGAKLFFFFKDQFDSDINVKIYVAFSEQDIGKGNAILWLTQHFGIFPVEIGDSDGEFELSDFEEFTAPSSLTLIIQSILFFDEEQKQNISTFTQTGGNVSSEQVNNLKIHVPAIEGLTDSFEKYTANRLIHQVGVFNQQLASNVEAITGPIIYLAGFNIQEGVEKSANFPPSKFIPWYLLLSNGQSIKRVYRQPELSELLQKLPGSNPYMVDIESIISDMEIDSNSDLK